jgi:hypothetical protein
MNSLLGLLDGVSGASAQPRVTPIREVPRSQIVPTIASVHSNQIHALVQQLFFRHESNPIRYVGFAAAEAATAPAFLCLEVAKSLADSGQEVGLIDACPDSPLLQSQLQIPSLSHPESSWPIGPRLWMVPRQSWLPDSSRKRITGQHLSRLRELTSEFDFAILCCDPVSWLTAGISQACDGLVLVLTANKTRRLVAIQIKEQLSKAEIPLLGTVLAERRFPVPQGLYRSL